MNRTNLLVVIFLSFLLFPCFKTVADTTEATPKYKIGAILPLSGDAAALGRASENGMRMALDTLPTKESSRIEVKFEDDGLVITRSVAAFRKLVDIDKVNAVICWSSGTCKAIAPLAEASKIPLVAIASDSAVSKGRKFAVNFWVTPEAETKALMPEALRRGYKRVAIVSAIQEGAQACRDAFLKQSQGTIEIAFNEEYPSDLKDFRSVVTRLKNVKDVDAILMILMPGQLGTFAKQLRQAGVQAPMFGYETFEDKSEVENSSGALVGSWFATASTGDESFVAKFKERFPEDVIVTANNGYDAIALLSTASSSNSSPETVAEFLRTVRDFPGVSGTFSSSGDNRFTLPATLKYVAKDGFEELS